MSFITLAGGTCAVTGGSNRTWTQNNSLNRGHSYVDLGTTDFRLRAKASLKSSAPIQNGVTGNWTRGRVDVSFAVPMLTTTGLLVYNTYRLSSEVHPELALATDSAYRHEAAQFFFDTELTTLWQAGATNF